MAKVNAVRVLWSTLCNSILYWNECNLPVTGTSNLALGGAVYRQSLKTQNINKRLKVEELHGANH